MEDKVKQIKRDVLTASFEAGACHIGSALSCVNILVDLFYNKKIHPKQFLFGKASGVGAYYAILADLGFFNHTYIAKYLREYPLPSKEVSGVRHSFGSVGHALPVACGLALADRKTDYYVLLSDGDCQEGATFEACLFAKQHHLGNLHVIVDNNGIQACGKTDDILNMDTVWGFMKKTLPSVEIVNTVKGEGVDFMENNYEWHYRNLDKELLEKARCQI
jgi:transketolase